MEIWFEAVRLDENNFVEDYRTLKYDRCFGKHNFSDDKSSKSGCLT